MEHELNKIAAVYNSLAKEWADAFANEHDNKPKDKEVLQKFAHAIGSKTPIWVFGCGTGNTTQYLKNIGIIASGLDLSEKIIEQAKMVHPGIHFQKGNILDLEFTNDSIAGIIAFYAIIHFSEKQVIKALQEIYRVLQPGGLFLFTYHIGDKTIHLDKFLGKKVDIDFMFFNSGFIINSLNKIGFKNISIIEREPYIGLEFESRRAYVFASKPSMPDKKQTGI